MGHLSTGHISRPSPDYPIETVPLDIYPAGKHHRLRWDLVLLVLALAVFQQPLGAGGGLYILVWLRQPGVDEVLQKFRMQKRKSRKKI